MKQRESFKKPLSSSYQPLIGATVVDTMGNRGSIQSLHQEGDATVATLTLEDGKTVNADLSLLERDKDSFFIPVLFEDPSDEYKNENQPYTQPDPQPSSLNNQPHSQANNRLNAQPKWTEAMKIPVMEEQIRVDKRHIDTGHGVRVRKHVLEHEETVNVPYSEETLSVEHIEIGVILSEEELPQARQEGDTYIIPVFEEVYVVEKRIRLKEEVHITRKRKESKEVQKIKLRSEQASIERFNE